jgi:hypothetical protein
MYTDPLKAAWNAMPEEHTTNISIKNPVLNDIRRQLTIESIAYTIFLITYYSGFDGNNKSFRMNAVLVVSVSLLLLHNIAGYIITKNNIPANNLKQSLSTYLKKIKNFAVLAIISRALAFSGIMLFFMSDITWNTTKYVSLTCIICILGIQIFSLRKIWTGRINKISSILTEYTNV